MIEEKEQKMDIESQVDNQGNSQDPQDAESGHKEPSGADDRQEGEKDDQRAQKGGSTAKKAPQKAKKSKKNIPDADPEEMVNEEADKASMGEVEAAVSTDSIAVEQAAAEESDEDFEEVEPSYFIDPEELHRVDL